MIPQWQYRLIQFQLAIVFFFGGVAKINPFWFEMHPVREILAIRADQSGLEFLTSSFVEYFIMIGAYYLTLELLFSFGGEKVE